VSRRWAVALLAALALAGCADPPESGYIYAKEASPGYYTTDSVCVAYDPKTGGCTNSVPMQQWHPPTWALCLEADNPGKDGKKARGCRDVAQETYDRYTVGDHFPNPA